MRHGRRGAARRRGAAATEAAILLPVLVLLAVIAFDFCRVFSYAEVLTNCARNGAVYASDPSGDVRPPYASVREAALADWPYDPAQLSVTSTPTTGADGHRYVDVRASCTFHTVVSYLGVPASVNLSRTVRVRQAPPVPNGL
jgi:Flp pilus assembly protein TadG